MSPKNEKFFILGWASKSWLLSLCMRSQNTNFHIFTSPHLEQTHATSPFLRPTSQPPTPKHSLDYLGRDIQNIKLILQVTEFKSGLDLQMFSPARSLVSVIPFLIIHPIEKYLCQRWKSVSHRNSKAYKSFPQSEALSNRVQLSCLVRERCYANMMTGADYSPWHMRWWW